MNIKFDKEINTPYGRGHGPFTMAFAFLKNETIKITGSICHCNMILDDISSQGEIFHSHVTVYTWGGKKFLVKLHAPTEEEIKGIGVTLMKKRDVMTYLEGMPYEESRKIGRINVSAEFKSLNDFKAITRRSTWSLTKTTYHSKLPKLTQPKELLLYIADKGLFVAPDRHTSRKVTVLKTFRSIPAKWVNWNKMINE